MSIHKPYVKEFLKDLIEGLSPEDQIKALKIVITEAENWIDCYETNLDNQINKEE